jgi:hypothetical protein
MIKFGLLKSKIEKTILESYSKNTFKTEMKNFKKYVLENKNISKLFYLYDEMSSNKGLNESVVDDYINECITIYENTINKLTGKQMSEILSWVKETESENQYQIIDDLFSTNVLTIESRISSRKLIKESLKKSTQQKKEVVNLPLSAMVNIANKTINNYVDNLNESEKKELIEFLKSDDEKLKSEFNTLRESVLSKLGTMKEQSEDSQITSRINETLEKVSNEKYDKLTFFKLKNLNESL